MRVDGEEVTIDILDTACRVSFSFSSVRNWSQRSQTNVELRDVHWPKNLMSENFCCNDLVLSLVSAYLQAGICLSCDVSF